MARFSRASAIAFGAMMLVLSAMIAVETLVRKLFSVSLGGVDELSGYAIAIGAPLAFTVALVEQSHIRINILHMNMPTRLQAVLNVIAALLLAALAIFLLVFTFRTVRETQLYQSIAQTPWATPLIWPQSIWLVAMSVFSGAAVFLAARALWLALRGDWQALNRSFGPDSVEEELKAELQDLARR
ncbi:MAG TPA: TRAP transporter small permease subunit [Paracoccaceae bacterium]|nr:TRAP transporter small permease subunit [Paracoccaceae bacterium]